VTTKRTNDLNDYENEVFVYPGKQTKYLKRVLKWYKENGVTPNDPTEGRWEQAHTPLPKSKGESTVPLLREHHVVHDLWQSQDVGERHFLMAQARKVLFETTYFQDGWFELCEIYEHFVAEHNSKAATAAAEKELCGFQRPDVKAKANEAKLKSKVWREAVRQSGLKTKNLRNDPEHQKKAGSKGGKVSGPKMAKKLNSQFWMSTVDFFVSRCGNVVRHNKSRGWDPNARILLDELEAPVATFGPRVKS
jgi:general stress protein YciG